MLTERQEKAIADAFGKRRGNRPIYEEEAAVIQDWALNTVIDKGMLDTVVAGKLLIDVKDGEVVFCLSTEGEEHVEQCILPTPAGQEMMARLDAKGDAIRDDAKDKSLSSRLLRLLYVAKDSSEKMNSTLVASILGCHEAAAALALKSLKDQGMIQGTSET